MNLFNYLFFREQYTSKKNEEDSSAIAAIS